MQDVAAVRTAAMLTASLGTGKTNDGRQLGPVDRVKPTMFARDRHDDSMSHAGIERKQKTPVIQIYHDH